MKIWVDFVRKHGLVIPSAQGRRLYSTGLSRERFDAAVQRLIGKDDEDLG